MSSFAIDCILDGEKSIHLDNLGHEIIRKQKISANNRFSMHGVNRFYGL